MTLIVLAVLSIAFVLLVFLIYRLGHSVEQTAYDDLERKLMRRALRRGQ